MSRHTPGPWQFIEPHFIGTVEDDPQTVAYVDAHRNRRPREHAETFANARLIAAAPELLAAAKDIWETTAQSGPINDYDLQAFGRLEAAIAKAEGRTP